MEGKKKRRLRESIFVDVPPFHVFLPPTQQYEDPPCKGECKDTILRSTINDYFENEPE